MSEDEKMRKQYMELLPEVRRDIIAYVNGAFAAQENTRRALAEEAARVCSGKPSGRAA
jgi:hypothetical protein